MEKKPLPIRYLADGATELPALDYARVSQWIATVTAVHGRVLGPVSYIFCDDEKILSVNREFLDHDYYTDIITFDDTMGRRISGDIFISLDTVASNAEMMGADFDRELHRVIIHGILHLCGIDDKGPGEREIMEAHEDNALALLALSSDTNNK